MNNSRNCYLDNAKFVLILLVVFGHFTLDQISFIPYMQGITNAIYSFHVPVFVFISGYVSKGATHKRSDVTKILYTFFVFQIMWIIYCKITHMGYYHSNLFIPTHQNWYLLAMFTWRLLVPYTTLFPRKRLFLVSVFFAFFVGWNDSFGAPLALHRTFYFMPIFLLGYYCDNINYIKNNFVKYRTIFAIILAVCLVSIFALSEFSPKLGKMIFMAYAPRVGNYDSNVNLFLFRIIGFVSSLLIGFSFLLLIPSRRISLLSLGKNTMAPYLLHMFYVYPIVYVLRLTHSYTVGFFSVLLLFFITVLISSEWVTKLLSPLTNMDAMLKVLNWHRILGSKTRRV